MADKLTIDEYLALLDRDPEAYHALRAAEESAKPRAVAPASKYIGAVDSMASEPSHCPHWTLDQGCPQHGETC